MLFESELDDNGISILSCKLRVMPDRMLLLCRQFMRLDNVLIRIRDTRIYVDFNHGKVIRDYTEREDGFDKVKKVWVTLSSVSKIIRLPLSWLLSAQQFLSPQIGSVERWRVFTCTHWREILKLWMAWSRFITSPPLLV